MPLEPIGHHAVVQVSIPSMPGRVVLFLAFLLTGVTQTGDLSDSQSVDGIKKDLADQTSPRSFSHRRSLDRNNDGGDLQLSTET
jgi:hypothetical protein